MSARRTRSLLVPALVLGLALAFTAPLASCSSSDTANVPTDVAVGTPANLERVDANSFTSVVATPSITVIDVRTPGEFAQSHIDGAVNYNVEGPDFAHQIMNLDPGGIYAVYCQSGNRSQVAVGQMTSIGVGSIFELESGITGWESTGSPVVSSS